MAQLPNLVALHWTLNNIQIINSLNVVLFGGEERERERKRGGGPKAVWLKEPKI